MGVLLSLLAALLFAASNILSRRASRVVAGPEAIAVTLGLNVVTFAPVTLCLVIWQARPLPDGGTLLFTG